MRIRPTVLPPPIIPPPVPSAPAAATAAGFAAAGGFAWGGQRPTSRHWVRIWVAPGDVPARRGRVDRRELADPALFEPEGDGVGQVALELLLRLVDLRVALDLG